jgi:alpha-L-fucosidase
MPYEATVTLSKNGSWFFHPHVGAKSVDELQDIFESATTQNNCLVFNLPPDKNGILVKDQQDALLALADRLKLTPGGRFPTPPVTLAAGATATASAVWNDPKDSNSYAPSNAVDGSLSSRWASGPAGTKQAWLTIDLGKPVTFNALRIWEYTSRIQKYQIETPDGTDSWRAIQTGSTIGPRCDITVPATTTSKIRLNILDATDAPSIFEIRVLDRK